MPTKKQEKSQRAQRSGGQSSSASANKIKVNALADIESALSKLELATQEGKKRVECNCMGTRHPLLEIAPNCLACGKINCSKEGFGPCLFCGQPLMTRDQVNEIMTILAQERDEIAQSLGKRARKQAGIKTDVASALDSANQRLDRLLQYQDTSAQRTKIIDQASDFETPSMGVNQWASPAEQARQLKQQQRRMRKMQEDHLARTGRGRKVVSIDLKGNKVYQVEQAPSQLSDSEEAEEDEADVAATDPENRSSDAKMLRFWDPKAYGKKFVKPEYVSEGHMAGGAVPEALSVGSQQPSRVVDDEDDETRLLEM